MSEAKRQQLIGKAEQTHRLTEAELAALLADDGADEAMAEAADHVRRAYVGDEVHLRGLIEFSSYCRQNCLYCGLRRDNGNAQRYRLTQEEIVALAEKAKAAEKPERKEEKKPEEAPKAEAPAKPASTRRKKISE